VVANTVTEDVLIEIQLQTDFWFSKIFISWTLYKVVGSHAMLSEVWFFLNSFMKQSK